MLDFFLGNVSSSDFNLTIGDESCFDILHEAAFGGKDQLNASFAKHMGHSTRTARLAYANQTDAPQKTKVDSFAKGKSTSTDWREICKFFATISLENEPRYIIWRTPGLLEIFPVIRSRSDLPRPTSVLLKSASVEKRLLNIDLGTHGRYGLSNLPVQSVRGLTA
jgi:hypothetical protein